MHKKTLYLVDTTSLCSRSRSIEGFTVHERDGGEVRYLLSLRDADLAENWASFFLLSCAIAIQDKLLRHRPVGLGGMRASPQLDHTYGVGISAYFSSVGPSAGRRPQLDLKSAPFLRYK